MEGAGAATKNPKRRVMVVGRISFRSKLFNTIDNFAYKSKLITNQETYLCSEGAPCH